MRVYTMRYYEFGKQELVTIEARSISEAEKKARAKMHAEFITIAWVVCPSGSQMMLSR